MSLTPVSFTGFSEFSDDFQAILQRTFEVANFPIQQLQTEQTINLAQQQALGDLSFVVSNLESEFASLGLLGATSAVTASSSDQKVAAVTVTGTPTIQSYDLVVTSEAKAAQETSLTGLADTDKTGLTADGIYKLTVGTTVTNIDLLTIGSGRTAGTTGSATPSPAVSVQVDFSNGLTGSITANLNSFFVAGSAPSGAGAGDTVSVTFVSEDTTINETITTVGLAGGDDATAIATLLNDQITRMQTSTARSPSATKAASSSSWSVTRRAKASPSPPRTRVRSSPDSKGAERLAGTPKRKLQLLSMLKSHSTQAW